MSYNIKDETWDNKIQKTGTIEGLNQRYVSIERDPVTGKLVENVYTGAGPKIDIS